MSLFLGPIHHMVYEKICYQDLLCNRLLEISSQEINKKINEDNLIFIKGNLEEIIDTENIHGWLNNQVKIVENRLSFIITELEKESKHEQLLKVMFKEGQKAAEGKSLTNCIQIIQVINNFLLDGMPCDKGVQIISKEENEVIFEYNPEVHLVFSDFNKYMEIRLQWIKGLISSEKNFNIIQLSERSFKLIKEE